MHHRRHPTRKQLAVAVGVSLLLHGGMMSSWLLTRGDVVAVEHGPTVLVEAPDNTYTVLTICDESPTLAQAKPSVPLRLPDAVRDIPSNHKPDSVPMPSHAPAGSSQGVHQVGHAESGRASLLHGQMKAGRSIVYVLDRSSSMSNEAALTRARASVLASLRSLNDTVKFQIVAYNSSARPFGAELCPATKENIERAEVWLNELLPEGRSEHQTGIREGLSFKSDALFLLTDADDLTANEVKLAESYIRQPVVIYAVLFRVAGDANSPLDRFVQRYRGSVRYVGSQP